MLMEVGLIPFSSQKKEVSSFQLSCFGNSLINSSYRYVENDVASEDGESKAQGSDRGDSNNKETTEEDNEDDEEAEDMDAFIQSGMLDEVSL